MKCLREIYNSIAFYRSVICIQASSKLLEKNLKQLKFVYHSNIKLEFNELAVRLPTTPI